MKNLTDPRQHERPVSPEKATEAASYEPPRITRKRSLERVTLGTGTVKPGGGVGGN